MPDTTDSTETDIYIKIKDKRKRAEEKVNGKIKVTMFNIGDKVLLKVYPISDAVNKIIAKFCELYEGPYVITHVLGHATYTLGYVDNQEKKRGTFNTRQIKQYYG